MSRALLSFVFFALFCTFTIEVWGSLQSSLKWKTDPTLGAWGRKNGKKLGEKYSKPQCAGGNSTKKEILFQQPPYIHLFSPTLISTLPSFFFNHLSLSCSPPSLKVSKREEKNVIWVIHVHKLVWQYWCHLFAACFSSYIVFFIFRNPSNFH